MQGALHPTFLGLAPCVLGLQNIDLVCYTLSPFVHTTKAAISSTFWGRND